MTDPPAEIEVTPRDIVHHPRQGEYVCENCGKRFTSTWSDEDAQAEYDQLFPEQASTGSPARALANTDDDALVIVCDECFRAMAEHYGWPI